MKRKPLRAIDIVNHTIHREASTGGMPERFMREQIADAPLGPLPKGFAREVVKLPMGIRRAK